LLVPHAAECERAIHIATDADRRSGLERLRTAWLTLAHDQQLAPPLRLSGVYTAI
jgi:hypothetical protein